MADKTRNNNPGSPDEVRVYDGPTSQGTRTIPTSDITTVVTPVDRIRWGPIFAGLFAALSTLVLLNVLGLAIGFSSYDPGDPLRNFGLGAGIWGAISSLIAFIIGGWLAARTAATRGRNNGVLNGAMVWAVTIPLLLYLLSSGVGAVLRTAGNLAATGVQAAAPVAGQVAQEGVDQPGAQATAQAAGQDLADAAQATASALGDQVTPQRVEQAADAASATAWGTLLALLLGLGASALGGLLGARPTSTTQIA